MAKLVNERSKACAFPGILMRFADGLRGWEIYKRCWRAPVAFFVEWSILTRLKQWNMKPKPLRQLPSGVHQSINGFSGRP